MHKHIQFAIAYDKENQKLVRTGQCWYLASVDHLRVSALLELNKNKMNILNYKKEELRHVTEITLNDATICFPT